MLVASVNAFANKDMGWFGCVAIKMGCALTIMSVPVIADS